MNIFEVTPLRETRFRTISRIDDLKRAQGERTTDWDFPVGQEELLTASGQPTGIQAVVRLDTGDYLGQYQRQSLLPNTELVERFESGLENHGIQSNRSIQIMGNGSRFAARYELIQNQTDVMGEVYNPILTIRNSYDGTSKVSLSLGMQRLICLNGMTGFASVFDLQKRHSPKLDAAFIASRILEAMRTIGDNKNQMESLVRIPLDDQTVLNTLGNLAKYSKGVISLKMASRIMIAWFNPTHDERPLGNNLYRLAQAGNRVFRDLQSKRMELASKARHSFGQQLILAANPNISSFARHAWDQLKALPADEFRLDKAKSKEVVA